MIKALIDDKNFEITLLFENLHELKAWKIIISIWLGEQEEKVDYENKIIKFTASNSDILNAWRIVLKEQIKKEYPEAD